MRLLKLLLASLAFSVFSGCAAYSVMNNDRYYSAGNNEPGMYHPQAGKCRSWYQDQPATEQPASRSCDDLQYKISDNAILLQG